MHVRESERGARGGEREAWETVRERCWWTGADEMSEIQEIRKSNANKYKSLSISIKRILSSSYHESNQHYKYL